MEKLELKQELRKYKHLLSASVFEYLESLVELEVSALKDYISDDEKTFLKQLSLYRNIENYNIYNRALQILKSLNDVTIYEYSKGLKATINKDEITIPLFRFDFNSLCKIEFQTYLVDSEAVVKERLYILNYLKKLNSLRERIVTSNNLQKNTFLYEYDNMIETLSSRFSNLANERSLTSNQKKIVNITQMCSDLFYEEYGLSKGDFESSEHIYPNDDKILFERKLVKQKPGMVINNLIKYI
ncbi:MAG: hypothetical protein E7158_04400 [Firmicutes bacterium]|nr:hypothetical protein [Bacillota bacterium]